MLTSKFGGVAITPHNLHLIKRCPRSNCVVVSAIGREYPTDTKTTDLLIRSYYDNSQFKFVADKYRKLVMCNHVNVDVDKLLFDAELRLRNCNSLSYAMSLGEELSAKVVASYLNAEYVEADKVVQFNSNGKLLLRQTLRNIRSAVDGFVVIAGFYGGCNGGRITFSRGGSDVTGSLCANATDSDVYYNWTDVCGYCVADPHKVDNVTHVACISYKDMYLLSRCGATVLHPQAVKYVQSKAIPIVIANVFNPYGNKTVVSNVSHNGKILGITEKKTNGKYVTTVVHNCGCGILQYFCNFVACNDVAVQSVRYSDNCLVVTTEVSVVSRLYCCLPVD